MAIRIAEKKDQRQVYEIMSYCFNSGNHCIEENCKKEDFPFQQFIVNENNGKIDNLIAVIPFKMQFFNKYYNMGGIGGVSSLPENRGNGGIANILQYSMKYMKDRNMIFSALGPFSMSFYRKYGYEWAFTWKLITIPVEDLKSFKGTFKYKKLTKDDSSLIEKVRFDFQKNMNGPIYRDEKILNERWNNFYNNFTHCYASLDENDNVDAVAFFKIEGKSLKVNEFYYLSEKARHNMLHFFYMHRSQVNDVEITVTTNDNIRNILPNCRLNCWEWPHMMFRIVMVKEALEAMKISTLDNRSFSIKVIDNQAVWNNKTFVLKENNGHFVVTETDELPDYEISIQRLSQLVIGFIDGKEAIQSEFVKVFNHTNDDLFIKSFTKQTVFLYQSF